MTRMTLTSFTDALQARLMSALGARMVKAPKTSLTTRAVAEPQLIRIPTRHGSVRAYVTRAAPGAPLATGPTLPPVHLHLHGGAFLVGAP